MEGQSRHDGLSGDEAPWRWSSGTAAQMGDPLAGSGGYLEASRRAPSQLREQCVQEPGDTWKGGQSVWELLGRLSSGAHVLAVGVDFVFCEDSRVPV